jgi:hypothetical protein
MFALVCISRNSTISDNECCECWSILRTGTKADAHFLLMKSVEGEDMNIWSRLGLSVAVAAVFCITLTEFCQQRTFYQVARWYGCIIFTAVGIAFGLVGFLRERQRRRLADTNEPSDAYESHRTSARFLFWGPVLLTFGAIIFFVPYKSDDKAALPVAARTIAPTPQTSAPPAAVVTPVPAEVVVTNTPLQFPDLKVQGIVFRPPKNAVIVNGRSYFVGDFIENAKVFSIGADTVVLEIKGHYKAIPFDRPSFQLRPGASPTPLSVRE